MCCLSAVSQTHRACYWGTSLLGPQSMLCFGFQFPGLCSHRDTVGATCLEDKDQRRSFGHTQL